MTEEDSELDAVRRSLYGGPRATFIERRTELARAARDGGDRREAKRISELRKPSAAAHVVNLLAQADDRSLQELVELGASIRHAMATGDEDATRSLLRGRATALATALHRAREIARVHGESVSAAVAEQITQTLRAAMAGDDAATAARSGTLTDALDEPGFEGVDIEPATPQASSPRPATKPSPPKSKEQDRARKKSDVSAGRAAADARRDADAKAAAKAAAKARAEHESALAAAIERRDDLAREREQVAIRLAEIDDQLSNAHARVDEINLRLRDGTTDWAAIS
jgi:hypothetical protein